MIRNVILKFPYLQLHLLICWIHFLHLSKFNKQLHKLICGSSFVIFRPVLCFLFKLLEFRGLSPLFFCSFRILINLSCIKYFKILKCTLCFSRNNGRAEIIFFDFHTYFPVHFSHQLPADIQSKTGTFCRTNIASTIKRIKQIYEFFLL